MLNVEFSFHEMGVLDLPAVIDYVLHVTQRQTVTLIGHSMGTTLTFAGLSAKPDMNRKINLFVALAPLTYREPFTNFIHSWFEGSFLLSKNYFKVSWPLRK